MEREEQFVKHKYIVPRSIEYRSYQVKAALHAINQNTLIILPTGTGKTVIGLLAIAKWIELHPNTKIIFIAPTRPLVDQHYQFLKKNLAISSEEIVWMSGEIPPLKRRYLWSRKVIISTPQVVYNDLVKGFFSMESNWLIIFDEAHRAVKEHPYAKISRLISSISPRIIGLTASPGDVSKTKEIMSNLQIGEVVLLTRRDEELRKYLQPIRWRLITIIPSPQLNYAIELIKKTISNKVMKFNNLLDTLDISLRIIEKRISYTYLDDLRNQLEKLYLENKIPNTTRKECLLILNQLIILDKLLTYIESYSYKAFIDYYEKLRSKALRRSLVAKLLLNDNNLNEAYVIIKELDVNGYIHPKIKKLVELLSNKKGKSIVFTSLKSVALEIHSILNSHGIPSLYLIGQNKGRKVIGMKQKEQIMTLRKFTSDDYSVLIATHVGEEGLDISEVTNVFFYDNPISAIRRIQREGRTGRTQPGNVYFLVMKNTRDEARYWAGLVKEKRLYDELKGIKAKVISMEEKIKPLTEFIQEGISVAEENIEDIKVFVDYRERSGDIINHLKSNGIKVVLDNLAIGDYIIGNYIIERKTMEDFASSIIDGRVFKQLKQLKNTGGKVLVIIEGELVDFVKKLDLNVYTGAIMTILEDYNIPLLITQSSKETAEFIVTLVKRLSQRKDKYARLRLEKKPLELKEIQKYVLAGIPGINTVLAEKLLSEFGSIYAIANAELKELMKVEGIGSQLAKRIYDVFHTKYTK